MKVSLERCGSGAQFLFLKFVQDIS